MLKQFQAVIFVMALCAGGLGARGAGPDGPPVLHLRSSMTASSDVRKIAFGKDGQTIVAALEDQTALAVWDAKTGKAADAGYDTGDKMKYVTALASSPDQKYIAATFLGGAGITILDSGTVKPVKVLGDIHLDLNADLAWTKDSKRLAVATGSTISYLDVEANKEMIRIQAGDPVKYLDTVDISPDGKQFVCVGTTLEFGANLKVLLYDTGSGKLQKTFAGNFWFYHAPFIDDKTVLLASKDSNAPPLACFDIAADPPAPKVMFRAEKGDNYYEHGAAISPNGKWAAGQSMIGKLTIWEVATGRIVWIGQESENAATAIAFSGDGKCVALANSQKKIFVWDVPEQLPAGLAAVAAATGPAVPVSSGGLNLKASIKVAGAVTALAFGKNGQLLYTGVQGQAALGAFDVATSKPAAGIDGASKIIGISALSLSPDLKTIAVASANAKGIRLINAATGKTDRTLDTTAGGASPFIAWSADGKRLAAAMGPELDVWETSAYKQLISMGDRQNPVEFDSVSFSTDGKLLVSIAHRDLMSGLINIADGDTGHVQKTISGSFQGFGIFLDDKDLLMPAGTVTFANDMNSFDISSGDVKFRHTFLSDSPVVAAAVSSNYQWAASITKNGNVRIYDAATGRVIWTLIGQKEANSALAFSGDGKLLAVGNDQGAVWVWEVPDQAPAKAVATRPTPATKPADKPADKAAAAAGDYAKKTLAGEAGFMNSHGGLKTDLANLEKAADAAGADDGSDATRAAALAKAVDAALDAAITRAHDIATRASETAANKQRARGIETSLTNLKDK